MTAKQISEEVRKTFKITPEDKVAWEMSSPATVQALMILSRPIRMVIRTYIEMALARYDELKGRLYRELAGINYVEQQLRILHNLLLEVQQPVENFFNSVPIDEAISSYVEERFLTEDPSKVKTALGKLLAIISDSIPIKVSDDLKERIKNLGFNDIDLFKGVKTYRDLRERISLILFRLASFSSINRYASSAIDRVETRTKVFKILKEILKHLS